MKSRKTKTKNDMDEIIRRIVEVARPKQVILFGSAARGTTSPHSDLDFLVVGKGQDMGYLFICKNLAQHIGYLKRSLEVQYIGYLSGITVQKI